jgi:hypothetical protein
MDSPSWRFGRSAKQSLWGVTLQPVYHWDELRGHAVTFGFGLMFAQWRSKGARVI